LRKPKYLDLDLALARDIAFALNAVIKLFMKGENLATQFPVPNAELRCVESAAFELKT
jgi:hypothetical protein